MTEHGRERSERLEDRARLIGQVAEVGTADTGNHDFQLHPVGVGQFGEITVDESDAAGCAKDDGVGDSTQGAAEYVSRYCKIEADSLHDGNQPTGCPSVKEGEQ